MIVLSNKYSRDKIKILTRMYEFGCLRYESLKLKSIMFEVFKMLNIAKIQIYDIIKLQLLFLLFSGIVPIFKNIELCTFIVWPFLISAIATLISLFQLVAYLIELKKD